VPGPETSSSCAALLGVEVLSDDPDDARARLEVRDDLKQPFGLVHGGVYSSLIETVCSRATALAVAPQEMAAIGQSLEISFLRPLIAGSMTVTARARHRGRSTWVWDAEATDGEGRVCALAKMTIAVRPFGEAKRSQDPKAEPG
jgi:1,4-dihydroxy-2-naphthoyl-CoA hydrolase